MRFETSVRDRLRLARAGLWPGGIVPGAGRRRHERAKVTYQDHVSAIFRNRCNGCHNADKQKGGLNLENLRRGDARAAARARSIEPGDPDGSTLFLVVTHKEEPKMPPERRPRSPTPRSTLIQHVDRRRGARRTRAAWRRSRPSRSSSSSSTPPRMGKPAGPPAMPESLSTEPFVVQRQAERGRRDGRQPLGAPGRRRRAQAGAALPARPTATWSASAVPRGDDPRPQVQPQRRPAAGRRRPRRPVGPGGRLGREERASASSRSARNTTPCSPPTSAPTTARSPSAGPSKIVRVYNTADGQLVYEMKKHTEWVTAVEFSPDGVLLATGDRNNGLVVWEAADRPRVLRPAAATPRRSPTSPGGSTRTSSPPPARTARSSSGRWRTASRSSRSRPTAAASPRSGSPRTAGWSPPAATASPGSGTRTAASSATSSRSATWPSRPSSLTTAPQVIAGDWSGEVRVWDAKDGHRLGNLAANPAPLAKRIEQTRTDLAAALASLKTFEPIQKAPAAEAAALEQAQRALAEAQQQAERLKNERIAAEKTLSTRALAARTAAEKVKTAQTALDKVKAAAEESESGQGRGAVHRGCRSAQGGPGRRREGRRRSTRPPSRPWRSSVLRPRKRLHAIPTQKTAVEQAVAAKAAADKALATAKPAIDAAVAQVKALQAEAEALAIDKKANDAAKGGLARSTDQP